MNGTKKKAQRNKKAWKARYQAVAGNGNPDFKVPAHANRAFKYFDHWLKSRYPDLSGRHLTEDILKEYVREKIADFRQNPDYNAHEALKTSVQDLCLGTGLEPEGILDGLDDPYDVVCPYCGTKANLVSSAAVYGKTYGGPRYLCPKCGCHVGTHEGTNIPLGTLANKELQDYRKSVHFYFDKLWQTKRWTRSQAYRWLAESLGLNGAEAHIAMFDVQTCKKALAMIGQAESANVTIS